LEGQRAGLAAADRSTSEESFRREKTRQNEEIAQLKEHLESARAARKESAEALDKTRSELIETQHSMSILSQRIEALDSDKAEVG
jgi:septal ring factor EnvC (AmiA/AmiB activator)